MTYNKLHEILPDYILENLRQRLGLDENDNSQDERFDNYSFDDVIGEYLACEGILGYSNIIKELIFDSLISFKQHGVDILSSYDDNMSIKVIGEQ